MMKISYWTKYKIKVYWQDLKKQSGENCSDRIENSDTPADTIWKVKTGTRFNMAEAVVSDVYQVLQEQVWSKCG